MLSVLAFSSLESFETSSSRFIGTRISPSSKNKERRKGTRAAHTCDRQQREDTLFVKTHNTGVQFSRQQIQITNNALGWKPS